MTQLAELCTLFNLVTHMVPVTQSELAFKYVFTSNLLLSVLHRKIGIRTTGTEEIG